MVGRPAQSEETRGFMSAFYDPTLDPVSVAHPSEPNPLRVAREQLEHAEALRQQRKFDRADPSHVIASRSGYRTKPLSQRGYPAVVAK